VTRAQAYKRLALLAFALWAVVAIAGRGPLVGAVLAAAVFAAGALAVELGQSRRRPPPEQPQDE
jgi:ABC-type branched-subunit amino acid transport system permease subunit